MSPVWNHPSGSMTAARRLRLVVVALHDVRAARENLAVCRNPDLDAGDRLPDRAKRAARRSDSPSGPGEVSVRPYPSTIGSPIAWKNSAIDAASGALPDTKYRSRPPARRGSSRTRAVRRARPAAMVRRRRRASAAIAAFGGATPPMAQSNIARFGRRPCAPRFQDAAVQLFVHARDAGHDRRTDRSHVAGDGLQRFGERHRDAAVAGRDRRPSARSRG